MRFARPIGLFLIAIILCLNFSRAFAYDFFSNCVTEKDPSTGKTTQVCGPCQNNPNAPGCEKPNGNPLVNIINAAAGIIALLTGVGAVIMIIVGGFGMVTSGGNAESVTKARRRIIYAVVALVIVALAYTITRFITDRLVQ